MNYDKAGVPILNWQQVEQFAEALVREFSPDNLLRPGPIPLVTIVGELQKQGRSKFTCNRPLGSRDGLRLLGSVNLRTCEIFIAPEVVAGDLCGPLFRFTLAHELGHLILHRDAPLRLPGWESGEHSDDRRSILDRAWEPRSPHEWLERQANRFAAALLMPSDAVHVLVFAAQSLMGLAPDRTGYIYHDSQPVNQGDLNRVVGEMKKHFEVSYSAAKRRLSELEILLERGGDAIRVGRMLRIGSSGELGVTPKSGSEEDAGSDRGLDIEHANQ